MAPIIIRRRLTTKEIDTDIIPLIEQWFREHPRRKVCQTDYWRVRRGHIREDIIRQEKPLV